MGDPEEFWEELLREMVFYNRVMSQVYETQDNPNFFGETMCVYVVPKDGFRVESWLFDRDFNKAFG